jgi:hypothetical protein
MTASILEFPIYESPHPEQDFQIFHDQHCQQNSLKWRTEEMNEKEGGKKRKKEKTALQ